MRINKSILRRVTGIAITSFCSALLGWFFFLNFSKETIPYFFLLLLGIFGGAIISSWD